MKNYFLILFIFFLGSAKNEIKNKSYSLKSPYHTLSMHIDFLKKDNFNLDIACLPFMQDGVSKSQARLYAMELKMIYKNEGIYIDFKNISQDPNYLDPVTKIHKYKISNVLPSIYLIKIDNKWLYSKETINNIDRLFKKITRFKVYKLNKVFPKSWFKSIFGIHIWQYVSIIIAIIVSYILFFLCFKFSNYFAKIYLKKHGFNLSLERYLRHIKTVNKFLIASIIFFLWLFLGSPALQLPIKISRYSVMFLRLLLSLNFIMFLYKLIDAVFFYIKRGVIEEKFEFNIDIIPLLRKTLKVTVVFGGCISVLKILDFDIKAILASISLGSLGIALASQDTIKNLFGSLMIFVDKPFKVGDMIMTKDVRGKVEEIGLRSTILKTPEQDKISVPNAIIANSYIHNKGEGTHIDFTNKIVLPAETKIEKVQALIEGFRDIIEKHPYTLHASSNVNLVNTDKGMLEIYYNLFFDKNPNYQRELIYRQEILIDILKFAEKLEISLKIGSSKMYK